jgi:ABC-type dipeptide/oligopeptide/nickel transport system permease component
MPVLFLMSIIVFLFIHLIPGDPVDVILGVEASQEARAALRAELGLDRNLVVQYVSWIGKLLTGDFGDSVISGRPVISIILEKFPATLLLAFTSILIALFISVVTGTVAAANKGTWKDIGVLTMSLFGVSIPSFWLGIMLIMIFSLNLGLFPAIGYTSVFENFPQAMRHLCLPAITLGATFTSAITRMTRSEMIEQLGRDYIITAWAKGLSRGQVIYKHGLKNSLVTVVTFAGMELGTLIGGTVVTETIFAWPGLGQLVVQSVFARDYPMVQGIVLILSGSFVLINLLVDISYTYLNPQIRFERKKQS